MEAKDSEIHEAEELKDLIECYICAKNFIAPRLLPCSHTFCLKCLENSGDKSNKLPGNAMACPSCAREFTIPVDGFSGLQRNVFVEKLMKMSRMVSPSSAGIQCDACLEESNSELAKAIPYAEMYCEECEQNLCQECCKQHSKFTGTKLHNVVDIGDHTKTKVFSEKPIQTLCILHGRVKLQIFCFDCTRVVCAVCFIETHQTHKGAEVKKVAEEFRKQIKEMVLELAQKESEVDGKCSMLSQSKSEFFQTLENLEKDVMQHYEHIKETAEKQLKLLLLKMENMRQTKLNEIADMKENLEKHAGNLAKHRGYCDDIAAAGSEVDVCQDLNVLSEKIAELKAQHDTIMELKVRPFETVFKKSSVDDFLFEFGETGMIGSLLG